jgi:protein-disulfide isomerase
MTRSTETLTRHERRLAERDDRRAERNEQRRATKRRNASRSAWRSPMALFTIAALLVGAGVVGFSMLNQAPAPDAHADHLVNPEGAIPAAMVDGRAMGSADAPVTVEVWSDFQCPACRSFVAETEQSVIDDFVVPGTARLVYRDAAFQGARGSNPSYDESVEAAAAARCAADQGLFWQMHNWIFANWNGENKGAYNAARLRSMAGFAGLELDQYDSCLATGTHQAAVRAETGQAVAAGVTSTPTVVINGQAYPGALTVARISQLITAAADAAR